MHTRDLPLADARALIERGDRQGAGHRRARRGRRRRRERRAGLGVADGPRRRRRHGPRAVEGVDRRDAADAERRAPAADDARCRSPMERGLRRVSPEAVFPGAGGMPIRHDDGAVVAGIAASGATVGPFVDLRGADPRKLIADGKPANARTCSSTTRCGSPTRASTATTSSAGSTPTASLPDEPGLGYGRSAAGRAAGARRGRWRWPTGRSPRRRRARRADRGRDRRPSRRPDPAGLHGRRADRRAVRRRGGRRGRGDVPACRASEVHADLRRRCCRHRVAVAARRAAGRGGRSSGGRARDRRASPRRSAPRSPRRSLA